MLTVTGYGESVAIGVGALALDMHLLVTVSQSGWTLGPVVELATVASATSDTASL